MTVYEVADSQNSM